MNKNEITENCIHFISHEIISEERNVNCNSMLNLRFTLCDLFTYILGKRDPQPYQLYTMYCVSIIVGKSDTS